MARRSAREQLLAAGVATIHARGFNACGVQDITDAAGVPKGSFYNHFRSKEEFGAEVVSRCAADYARASQPILEDASLPARERLRRYFDAAAGKLADQGYEQGCVLANLGLELADQSELMRRRLSEHFADWTAAITACIRAGQEAGEIDRGIDAATLAGFVLSAWEGAVMRAKVDRDGRAFALFHDIVFGKLLA